MKFIIFTDGSCDNHLPAKERVGGWAFVVLNEAKAELYRDSGNFTFAGTPVTSQRAEMMAVIKALEYVWHANDNPFENLEPSVVIYSDSAYIVNCFIQQWYMRWLDEKWVGVKNADLWNRILDLYFSVKVNYKIFKRIEFIHIKGHKGNKWNELADKLAGEARKRGL